MNPWVLLSIVAGSIAAFLSAAAYVFGGAPGWRDLRRYSLIALSVAVYCFTDLCWAIPPSFPQLVVGLNQVQLASAAAFVASWLWYGAELDARKLSPLERWLIRLYLVAGALAVLPGLAFKDTVSSHRVEALGLEFSDITVGWPGVGINVLVVLGTAGLTFQYCRRWYQGDALARPHAIGLLLILLGSINDSAVATRLVPGVYLLSTAFLVSVVLSARRTASRMVAYGRELEALSSKLERTVDERTRELTGAQVKLGRAEKLMALGQLAGGVAHEINNPAAVIRCNLDYLQEELREKPGQLPADAARSFDDCLEAIDRIAHIVRSLSHAGKVAHRSDAKTAAFGVGRALEAAIGMAQASLKSVVVERVCDGMLSASGQGELFSLVVANLLRNAAQAIETSGCGSRIELVAVRRGDRLLLTVKDDGPGMPPELHAKVFEPFFTTKQVGSGTGLGLAVSLGLMRAQGGNIELVESRPGRTIFAVEMPIGEEVTRAVSPPRTAAVPPPRLRRLLLIDDDAMLISAMRRMLRGHYLVETAGGVNEALERARVAEPVIDAILCDVSMPDGGGERVFAELTQWAPELARRVLFVTGGAVSEASRDFIELHRGQVIFKPLERAQLAARLEQLPRPAEPGVVRAA